MLHTDAVLTTPPFQPLFLCRCRISSAKVSWGETNSPFDVITPNLSASPSVANPMSAPHPITVSIRGCRFWRMGSGFTPPNIGSGLKRIFFSRHFVADNNLSMILSPAPCMASTTILKPASPISCKSTRLFILSR